MCLAGEVCIKYPQDLDLHCVPQSLIDDPITPEEPTVPEDCWKQLGAQNGIFPPNSSCWIFELSKIAHIDRWAQSILARITGAFLKNIRIFRSFSITKIKMK